MASVTYEHITKTFGNVLAVSDLSIDIPDKEFLVFVGPSGCGKTTSLPCWLVLKNSPRATSTSAIGS